MYGVRGVSEDLPGLLLLPVARFEYRVGAEPEVAGVWGKEYRARFRGDARHSEDLFTPSAFSDSGMLHFLVMVVVEKDKLPPQNQIHKTRSRGRVSDKFKRPRNGRDTRQLKTTRPRETRSSSPTLAQFSCGPPNSLPYPFWSLGRDKS